MIYLNYYAALSSIFQTWIRRPPCFFFFGCVNAVVQFLRQIWGKKGLHPQLASCLFAWSLCILSLIGISLSILGGLNTVVVCIMVVQLRFQMLNFSSFGIYLYSLSFQLEVPSSNHYLEGSLQVVLASESGRQYWHGYQHCSDPAVSSTQYAEYIQLLNGAG